MSIIIPANSAVGGGAQGNSLRFNAGSSDFLNRTFGTPTNNKKYTYSTWVKRCDSQYNVLFNAGSSRDCLRFRGDNDRLHFFTGEATSGGLQTNRIFVDPAAFYHIVLAVDTTQGTDTNRVKIYVNGVQQTSFAATNYPSQNYTNVINSAVVHRIAHASNSYDEYFAGYMAETVFIDGLQLTPTSFGQFNGDSDVWQPIDVSGLTFGNNGFYLDFEDSSALGNDAAGSNNWTTNNLTAIDQSNSSPTNIFATWNRLGSSSQVTLSEGNLKAVGQGSNDGNVFCNIVPKTGKWYAEFKITKQGDGIPTVGIRQESSGFRILNGTSGAVGYYNYEASVRPDGQRYTNNSTGSWGGSTFATGSIVGIALDCDNGAGYISVNGTYMNSGNPTSGASKTGAFITWTEAQAQYGGQTFGSRIYTTSSAIEANFGSPPYSESGGNSDGNSHGNFKTSPPNGFLSLCTANISEVLS